jgi:hypothetical protein
VTLVQAVADTLDPAQGPLEDRRQRFENLQQQFATQGAATEPPDSFVQHLAKLMISFLAGLFVAAVAELPRDNLELERWFRQPKGHARRIHGRRHAGTRLVYSGATLTCALDAHQSHLGPFTAQDLAPYHAAQPPPSQQAAQHRQQIMRTARSTKRRPPLLANLEHRYHQLN